MACLSTEMGRFHGCNHSTMSTKNTKMNFPQIAEGWKAQKRKYVKTSTYATYVTLADKHIIPFFQNKAHIDEQAVQQFIDQKLAEGLSIKTVKDILQILHGILHYGFRHCGLPQFDYSVHWPATAQQRTLPVLSQKDQRRLTAYLMQQQEKKPARRRLRNLGVLICLQTGLRIGELCGLRWEDVDLAQGLLHVRRTVSRVYYKDGAERKYELLVDSPKTPSAIRDIPIAGALLRDIRPMAGPPGTYVLSGGPAPLEPRTMREHYYRLLRRLGMGRIRFHGLRHSFATRCVETGCDYKTISAILGHASISTTMDLYVHPGIDQKRRCIEKMMRGVG